MSFSVLLSLKFRENFVKWGRAFFTFNICNLVGFDKSPTNPAEIAPKGRIQSLATVMDPTVTAPYPK